MTSITHLAANCQGGCSWREDQEALVAIIFGLEGQEAEEGSMVL